jgi:hypothetical protein
MKVPKQILSEQPALPLQQTDGERSRAAWERFFASIESRKTARKARGRGDRR